MMTSELTTGSTKVLEGPEDVSEPRRLLGGKRLGEIDGEDGFLRAP